MQRGTLLTLLVVLAGVLALWWWNTAPRQIVYHNGPVLTMAPDGRVVEALGVEGDRIAVVGSEAEVRAWASAWATDVDLEGHALLPGFIDAHSHFPGEGIWAVVADLNSPPIGDVERIDQVIERMRQQAQGARGDDWAIGMGYDDTLLAERRHPTREDLDRASRERPLVAVHISGHLGVVNSAGLAKLGIDATTPDPEGGHIRRDARTGEPTGVLEETAIDPALFALANPPFLDAVRIVREADRRYLRAGVTTAQNGYTTPSQLRGLSLLSRLGLIHVRLVLWPGLEAADALLDGRLAFSSYDEQWVRLGATKLVADGSIQGYTGYLSQPYHVPPGDDPGYRGYPRIPRDQLIERVGRYHRAGMQVAIHGNGDAAIDDALDAIEQAERADPRPDPRPVVIHAQMTRGDQLDRMKALGVIPSFFSLHTYYWGDRHRDIFMGPERAARMSPARSALERGVRFTIHTDAPVVPMDTLRLVWAAVNRRSTSGAEIGPAERIGPLEALRAVTLDAAYQHFEEGLKGSLEPGKLADLVILSESPLDAPERIDRIRVLETIVGGRTLYHAPE